MTTRDLERIRFVTEHFTGLQGLRTVPMGIILMSLGLSHFIPSWPKGIFLLVLALNLGSMVMIFWVPSYYRSFGEVQPRPAVLGTDLSLLSIYRPAGAAPLAVVERRPMKASVWMGPLMLLAVVLIFLPRAVLPSTLILTNESRVDPWAQFHAPVVAVLGKPTGPSALFDECESLASHGFYTLIGASLLSTWLVRGRRLSQSYHLVLGSPLLGLAVFRSCLGLVVMERWKLGMAHVLLLPLAYFWMAALLCGTAAVIAGLLDHWQIVRVLRPVKEQPFPLQEPR